MSASDHWHNGFSFEQLGHRLRSMPMLVVLLPFVAGIVLADYFVVPLVVAIPATLLFALMAALVMPRRVAWGYIVVALAMFGYTMADLRMPRSSVPYDTYVDMVVTVENIPVQRDGYRRADGRIERWRDDGVWHDADSRVVLWLRADSINEGDRVVVAGELRERISRYNDYNDLMHRRSFVGGVAIGNDNVVEVHHAEPTDMQTRAIRRLEEAAGADDDAHATMVAMTTGSRHNMPESLRWAYSRTGLAHLLAVSGLHLGIVLMVVGSLLAPLRFIHRGHRVAALLAIVAIWLYVSMCGASPSVVRAAIMLTVLQLAMTLSARYNSINALAATVVIMLMYRPNYLYDISFQLSVAAVFGIVAWGVPIVRRVRSWRWLWRQIIGAIVVGVVATLWTLPVVSHTFDNLPIVGAVVTPFVLLFAYVTVICGIIAVVLPTSLATPLVAVAEWAAHMQNIVVEWAAELPFAAIEYTMSGWGVVVCYAIYLVITLVGWMKYQKKVITLHIQP